MNVLGAGLKSLWNGWGPRTVNVGPVMVERSNEVLGQKGKLKGRLFFNDVDRQTGQKMPNSSQRMELHTSDLFSRFSRSTCIGKATTNQFGQFEIEYEPPKGCYANNIYFQIKLVDEARPFSSQKLSGANAREERITRIYQITIPKHTCEATVDLLSEDSDKPFSLTKVPPPSTIQWQSNRYLYHVFKASLPFLAPAGFVSLFGRWMSGAQVQKIYNLLSPKFPTKELTSESLIHCLLNGIGNVGSTQEGNKIRWVANWDQFKFKEGREQSIPNIEVEARIENGQCVLERIRLKFRGDMVEEVFEANDPKINRAIYLAFGVFGLKGEAEHHLAEGHLLPRVTSKFFEKYISRENPLFFELRHFCGEIDFIDYLGANEFNGLIFGNNGSLSGSPIEDSSNPGDPQKGLAQHLEETVREKADWRVPYPPPRCEQDSFNYCANVHYKILLDYYTQFVKDNREGLAKYWREIYFLSEAMNQTLPRCPTITKISHDPQDEDFTNLALFLARHVATVTWIHDRVHKSQDDLKNIFRMSVGVRDRALDSEGNFAPDGNTSARDANIQLLVTGALLQFNKYADRLFRNEVGDIPPAFIDNIERNIHLYKGYSEQEVRSMMSTTKI